MKPPFLTLPFAFFAVATSALAQAPAAPMAATPAASPVAKSTPASLPPQKPDVAAIKYEKSGEPNAAFMSAHKGYSAIAAKGGVDLLFLGDSITNGWNGAKSVWEKAFGEFHPANFGIGGDRTQHVLWRIENGELEGIKPKVAVLLIGTNNVSADPAEGIAGGITKIVQTIQAKLPETKILLLAVFPRGEKAEPNPYRPKLAQVNRIISQLDDEKHVFFLDIGDKFLLPDGSFNKAISSDFLHLNPAGYQIWADAMLPKLAELMK